MSSTQFYRSFPRESAQITEKELANHISKILKNTSPKAYGGVKYLSKEMALDIRKLYNWYYALNNPDLLNFINLAKNIPELLNLFITLCEREDIYQINPMKSDSDNYKITNIISGQIYSFIRDEGINIFDRIFNNIILNKRQKWFVEQIKFGKNIKIIDLMFKYGISKTTAERDLRYLKNNKIIKFEGGKRGGAYVLIKVL